MSNCENEKVAFYIMGSKGLYVLRRFIETFGSSSIKFIVGAQDSAIKYDAFDDIKLLARNNGITFLDKKDADFLTTSDLSVTKFAIGWRWLIKDEINLLVLHDSLLPKYRGFAPLVNSLINKELEIGVTCLLASKEYDCGDIVFQKSIAINYPITISEAIEKIEPLYFELVELVYKVLSEKGVLPRVGQCSKDATYSLWLDSNDYFIDWSWSAEKIRRFVDAVSFPYGGARACLDDDIIIFMEVEEVDDVYVENRARHVGKVVFNKGAFPVVVCSEGLLALKKITNLNCSPKHINFRSRFK